MNAPRNEENDGPQGEGDRPDTPAEGTSPPGNPQVDEEALQESKEQIEKAGGGH